MLENKIKSQNNQIENLKKLLASYGHVETSSGMIPTKRSHQDMDDSSIYNIVDSTPSFTALIPQSPNRRSSTGSISTGLSPINQLTSNAVKTTISSKNKIRVRSVKASSTSSQETNVAVSISNESNTEPLADDAMDLIDDESSHKAFYKGKERRRSHSLSDIQSIDLIASELDANLEDALSNKIVFDDLCVSYASICDHNDPTNAMTHSSSHSNDHDAMCELPSNNDSEESDDVSNGSLSDTRLSQEGKSGKNNIEGKLCPSSGDNSQFVNENSDMNTMRCTSPVTFRENKLGKRQVLLNLYESSHS